jgi:DNA-binding CsgD family transcriptional regulator
MVKALSMTPQMTPTETRVLIFLSHGTSPAKICAKLKMTRTCFHVHCHHIRQKTGIDTHSQFACREQVRGINQRIMNAPRPTQKQSQPTPQQRKAMELFYVQGMSAKEVSFRMNISPQTVLNQLHAGCKRAGITAHGQARAEAVKALLGVPAATAPGMDDPMF